MDQEDNKVEKEEAAASDDVEQPQGEAVDAEEKSQEAIEEVKPEEPQQPEVEESSSDAQKEIQPSDEPVNEKSDEAPAEVNPEVVPPADETQAEETQPAVAQGILSKEKVAEMLSLLEKTSGEILNKDEVKEVLGAIINSLSEAGDQVAEAVKVDAALQKLDDLLTKIKKSS